ncbi:MAG: hypothetical protein KF817_08100 [Phycisphaeraceae bacterium]|nr:hypothetical protein [Phycisphaeraceae bacterium]
MPIGDWQFWVVTFAALLALSVLLRPVVRAIHRRGRPGTRRRATLTIEGHAPGKSGAPDVRDGEPAP